MGGNKGFARLTFTADVVALSDSITTKTNHYRASIRKHTSYDNVSNSVLSSSLALFLQEPVPVSTFRFRCFWCDASSLSVIPAVEKDITPGDDFRGDLSGICQLAESLFARFSGNNLSTAWLTAVSTLLAGDNLNLIGYCVTSQPLGSEDCDAS